MSNKPTNCKDCNIILPAEIIAQQKCRCVNCQLAFNRKKQNARKTKENHEMYKDRNDMLVCKECGWKVEQTGNLFQHIKMHGLNKDTYCEKFNCDASELSGDIYKIEHAERVKGDKNPGYQHGGKFSSLSKNFKKYDGLSDDEIEEKKAIVVEKISESNKNNGNTPTTLLYWLNQGYSEDEAMVKLSERQTTFSKEICIQKYGEIEGIKIWQERQDRWLKSYNNKTPEEMEIINGKKTPSLENFINRYGEKEGFERYMKWVCQFAGVSALSQDLFWDIYDKLPDNIKEMCYFSALNREYNIVGKLLDFYIDKYNIAIEFLGDYWHANPNKYNADFMMSYPRGVRKLASEVWERDKQRHKFIKQEKSDIKILYIWEAEYKNDPRKILKQILEIINNIIKEGENVEILNEDIGLVKGEVK